MAPIGDNIAQALRDDVHKLHMRIQELENKLAEKSGSGPAPDGDVRMILMGPPGAGMSSEPSSLPPQLLRALAN
jgi:adenylate kinase